MSVLSADVIVRFPSIRPKTGPVPAYARFGTAAVAGARVTALRPVPVGRPTFGRPPALVRPTVDPLLASAVSTAFETLDMLERRAWDTARAFRDSQGRGARLPAAKEGLADLVCGIRALVDLADTAADALGVELESVGEGAGARATAAMRTATSSLIAHQATADWIALAHCLESSGINALIAWREVVESLDVLTNGTGPQGHAA